MGDRALRELQHQYDHVENNGMSACSVECDGGSWETVTQRSQKTKRSVLPSPPGLQVSNRFEGLSESWDFGGLEVLIPETAIAGVGTTGRLRSAGRGKVTIDSGAAESVMLRGMLEGSLWLRGKRRDWESNTSQQLEPRWTTLA